MVCQRLTMLTLGHRSALLTFFRTTIPLLASRAYLEVVRVPAPRASRGTDVVPLRRDDLLKETPG